VELPDPRRLAAADMWGTRGSPRRRRIIRAEFILGTGGCTLLGILTLLKGSGLWILLGVWLIGARQSRKLRTKSSLVILDTGDRFWSGRRRERALTATEGAQSPKAPAVASRPDRYPSTP
jgi:hypothetical protein